LSETVFLVPSVESGYKGEFSWESQFSFKVPACQDMGLGAEKLELSRVPELAVSGGSKGKVVPVLNLLNITPRRRIGEWLYRSKFSRPRH
jgi:hypothetical protein